MGCVFSRCASSSLYATRWAISISQKYFLTSTFCSSWSLDCQIGLINQFSPSLLPIDENVVEAEFKHKVP